MATEDGLPRRAICHCDDCAGAHPTERSVPLLDDAPSSQVDGADVYGRLLREVRAASERLERQVGDLHRELALMRGRTA